MYNQLYTTLYNVCVALYRYVNKVLIVKLTTVTIRQYQDQTQGSPDKEGVTAKAYLPQGKLLRTCGVCIYTAPWHPLCVFYTPVMVDFVSLIFHHNYGRSYRSGTILVALLCTFAIKVTSLANQGA